MVKENCGIVGVYGSKEAAEIIYFSLFSLQHRGQESCGILTSDGKKVYLKRAMGLVPEVFSSESIKELKGSYGIGHTRYSTTGSSSSKNIQPFFAEYQGREYGISHNGNLINSGELRKSLEEQGSLFQTTLDTEILMHLITRSKKDKFIDKLMESLPLLKGAFSLTIFTPEGIIAVKDPWNFRPLCLGRINGGYVVASESCAFDFVGAEYIRELEAGEVLTINDNGLQSHFMEKEKSARCIFEFVYFARPDSKIFGESVYFARKRLGASLADEFPYRGDIVVPVPDSGNIAGLGFAQRAGIPYEMGIVRNHYVGRTFIQPLQTSREMSVKIKLNPIREVVKNKKVIVVEDSIVRGTTSRFRVKNLRAAGASEIYMAVSCPPIKSPCFYGVDFPYKKDLIAVKKSEKEIKETIGVDGLYYLSLEGMLSSVSLPAEEFCTACFTGKYKA